MGYRMFVHKKHVVEFADRSWFNWESEAANTFFLDLYTSLFAYYPYSNNEEYPQYGSQFEYYKEDWKMMIEKLEEDHKDDQSYAISDYTYAEVIQIMKDILEFSDPDNDVIFLEWC